MLGSIFEVLTTCVPPKHKAGELLFEFYVERTPREFLAQI
jgi:hypothetical protein